MIQKPLIDPFKRRITYLRVSVTDRCDLRCFYCMAESMKFLPKADLLTFEELDRVCTAFISLGVRKIRITGGEPLVRRHIMTLFQNLGRHLNNGTLDELTLTTNGSQLEKYAHELVQYGVRRVNVSLDTLDPDTFQRITRGGSLTKVLRGIKTAVDTGLSVKINCVVLKGVNDQECHDLIRWCGQHGYALTFIEVMPMGDVDPQNTHTRLEQYFPLSLLRARLKKTWTLKDIPLSTGGPARYVFLEETKQTIGFITPLTHNFCELCNRVRLTCTGMLYMCLGQEDYADLRTPLRTSTDNNLLIQTIAEGITRKPKGHDFLIDRNHTRPAVPRHMSVTGG